ncbi:MAG: hypothetical protein N2167_11275 [Flavobacteriales bacterium]|nr:hypothetical protein [Flavobacteriales bacterium]
MSGIVLIAATVLSMATSTAVKTTIAVEKKTFNYPYPTLSSYGLFIGIMKEQKPADRVIPYTLPTPLFSDYAYKLRFVYIPSGKQVTYHDKEVFQFPVGTILVKTFYYPYDFRYPEKGRKIIETRLLIHEENGWKAYPYIWNEEQTEAYLEVAGDTKLIQWTHSDGKKMKINYSIPNANQCKSCHESYGQMTPIGPTARQLNSEFSYNGVSKNQIAYWVEQGILTGVPKNESTIPKIAVWHDAAHYSLNDRARAYLDINCAHCHKTGGQAATSGLNLSIYETQMNLLGVYKAPVAAGKGAANMKYSIEPGNPDKSILVYRMESTDPGIMMPEMGRQLIDKEGVTLIREWISQMEKK